MAKDDEKLLRQLSLLSFLLSRPHPATPMEIRRSVEGYAQMSDEAFARRFYGDREDLRRSGIVIEKTEGAEQSGGEAYFLPDENYRLPDLTFSAAELTALTVALSLLGSSFLYACPLRLALLALTRGRPNPLEEETQRVAVGLAPDHEAAMLGRHLARLEEAIGRGKSVKFRYYSVLQQRESERVLDPYALLRLGGHWYVVGRDQTRDALRTFRVGRIRGSIHFLTRHARDFCIPPDFEAKAYRSRPPWLLGEPVGVARLKVDEDLAWWVERSFPPVRREEPGAGDATFFTTAYAEPDALASWVLGLGGRAEIIAPGELRTLMVERLTSIRNSHA